MPNEWMEIIREPEEYTIVCDKCHTLFDAYQSTCYYRSVRYLRFDPYYEYDRLFHHPMWYTQYICLQCARQNGIVW